MSRNLGLAIIPPHVVSAAAPPPPTLRPRSLVLVGMPGSGKTSVGRRLAQKLGLPFRDADSEIEAAAGQPVTEIFARYGEPHFREGERRIIARLLDGPPIVLATGGGAFNDAETRAAIRAAGAAAIWLRAGMGTLLTRVAGRTTRPMFLNADPVEVLTRLMTQRHPLYAEADIVIDCRDTDTADDTTEQVAAAIAGWRPPTRQPVVLGERSYEVVVGDQLLARAGALMKPALPAPRVAIVTDSHVGPLHLATLRQGLEAAGLDIRASITVPAGEASKSLPQLGVVLESLMASGVDRRTTVVALGGGVVGDLAGFAAATALRGLPFVQVPTSLLAQVDSSVGGKTGINLAAGKNLAGAFHQPILVLADTGTLATLPPRELRAGYAEVAKHGLLDGPLWDWCEANGAAAVTGDPEALRHAVLESCRLKSAVVAADEREESPEGGRALLNLGHTFGHALEAECGYDGSLLHGEGVALGLGLAARLSAALGHCDAALPERVEAHLAAIGLPSRIRDLERGHNSGFTVPALMGRMRKDKKVRDGMLRFVLIRAPGDVFTATDVPAAAVEDLLRAEGCRD